MRLEEALCVVAQRAAEALGSPECVVFEYDPALDAIIPRAQFEAHPTGWNKIGVPLPLSEHAVERRLLQTGELLEERLSQPDLDPVSRSVLEEWGDKMCLSVPLRVHDESKGILVVFESEHERHFSDEELAFAGVGGDGGGSDPQCTAGAPSGRTKPAPRLAAGRRAGDDLVDGRRELLTTLARKASEALGCPECIIWEYDVAADALAAQALYQSSPAKPTASGVAHAPSMARRPRRPGRGRHRRRDAVRSGHGRQVRNAMGQTARRRASRSRCASATRRSACWS